MSLNWLWSEKMGELIVEQDWDDKKREFNISLYEGNAFLIMLYEYRNDEGESMYNMWNFFVDKEHAKRCLGLAKNGEGKKRNIFVGGFDTVKKIRLNKTKSRHFKDIVSFFSQAFDDIVIEVFSEEKSEN